MLKARKQATDDSQRSEVVHSLTALETTNHKVRGTFSQIALSMNGLMAACLKAKQGYEQPKRVWLNGYLQEITAIVEELNAGINEV